MQTHAATITVTNTNDGGPSSLRQALTDAHDGDRIGFSAALNGQTITLTSAELVIDKDITTNGPGPDLLAVSRSSNTPFRIFHVMPGHIVTIQGLMLTGGGDAENPGGGILNDHGRLTVRNCAVESNGSGNAGGGIFNDGSNGSATLTIINSAVSYNGSPAGGGIGNNGDEGSATLTIVNSAVNYNVATGGSPPADFGVAGGIASSSGIVTITNSTISGNSASNEGGGVLSGDVTLTITNTAISGNRAGFFGTNNWPGRGGGISAQGPATISNSTISGNSAPGNDFKGPGVGGGIDGGDVTVMNSTISGNSATICGGICGGTIEIGNTILNANASGNIDGTVTSHGYNISSDDGGGLLNGPGDQINTDPLLGPLQNNGGQL